MSFVKNMKIEGNFISLEVKPPNYTEWAIVYVPLSNVVAVFPLKVEEVFTFTEPKETKPTKKKTKKKKESKDG